VPISRLTGSKKLPRRTLVLEVVLGVALFSGGAFAVWHAIGELRQGRPVADIVETLAIAAMLFGGCLDPVNSVALALPWVADDIVEPSPYSRARWFFFLVAFVGFVGSWIWRHWVA
jgi:hypothetical protein